MLVEVPLVRGVGVSYLGEYCASRDDKSNIDHSMNWIDKCVVEIDWRRHVIGNTTCSMELGGTLLRFPGTDQLHKNWEYSISDSSLMYMEERAGRTIVRETGI